MSDPKYVEVRGLRELNAALRAVDDDAKKALKTGFREIAEKVASRIRPKVPRITGTAASSIKARGSTRGGAIAFGGSKAPYYPWLDFGGGLKTGRGVRPGGGSNGRREFIKSGRYVYPTIAEMQPEIVNDVDGLIKRVLIDHGFETRGDN